MYRRVVALLSMAFLCCMPGCLFVNHSTKVVRDKEPMQRVAFESEQARQAFVAGVHDLQTRKQSYNFQVSAVPLLWWRSSANELSDNAIYNDQISVCDTNGDGVISTQEGITYRSVVAAQIHEVDQHRNQESHQASATVTNIGPPTRPQPAPTPPGLIRTATKASD
jgi:hypothetical protein